MRVLRALLIVAALASGAARAQPVTSAGPDRVSVSIYRAPDRDADQAPDLNWPEGYALITETRTIRIPAGRAAIRFEGVAAGILPESAIVTGLPAGVREKNLDAELLSARSLYARNLNRPVTIRRTRGGKVREESGIIRSGAEGAAILETREGFTALACDGSDSLVYSGVPAGLSAKPTLSIETDSPRDGRAQVTLSYLAWGFDWQANYVATMRPDGRSADLFAWVTLASGDSTSFDDAQAMVIAGKPHREDSGGAMRDEAEPLEFACLSQPIEELVVEELQRVPAPAPPMMAMAMRKGVAEDIVVTGTRVRQEDLGDLKLYRVPHATTVAAKSQKQVAMLDQPSVPVDVIYRSRIADGGLAGDAVRILLRLQNRKDKGLGVPLPQGAVAVFEPADGRKLLVGEGAIADKAVGEEVEIEFAAATQVTAEIAEIASGKGATEHRLTVRNASPFAIRYEAELETSDAQRRTHASTRLGRKRGKDLWAIEIPANGERVLNWRLKAVR